MEILKAKENTLNKVFISVIFLKYFKQVEDEYFPCHKVILAARIPYFKSMFTIGMEKNFDKVILQDVPSW